MRKSSKQIFSSSRNTSVRSLGGEDKQEADYSQGIPVAREKETGELVYIDFNSTTKVGLFGPSGSGKTIFAKAMVSRLHQQGRTIYNGGDVKNDFQSLDNEPGASKDLIEKMGLMKNEERQPIPKKLFMPKFLTNHYDHVPSYVEPFTFGFQDLSEEDLMFVLSGGDMDSKAADLLRRVLDKVDLESTSFDEVLQVIEEDENGHRSTKNALKRNIETAKQQELVSNRYRMDPLKFLDEGYAVSLGLEGWRNYSRGSMYKLEFYAAVLLDSLKDRASSNDIETALVCLWPEFHKLCAAGSESLLKPVIEDWFNLAGRQMDMPALVDSQAPSQVPNAQVQGPYNFLGKLNHVFLGCDQNGRPIGESEWKRVLKSLNMLTRSNKGEWRSKMQSLDTYDFLYLNPGRHSRPSDCPVVRSLSPLCSHPG